MTPIDAAWVAALSRGDHNEAARLEPLVNQPQPERKTVTLGSAALWYAQQGWPVFPIQPGGKQPACKHGFKDATTESEQVRAWWCDTPEANIGLPTGQLDTPPHSDQTGVDVFDFDGDPDGVAQFQTAALADQDLPRLAGIATTPRGAHLFIPATGLGNKAGIYPGVDFRGTGGYVVVPPSRAAAGVYCWLLPLGR